MALVNRLFSVNVTPGMMPPIVHVSEYDVGRAYTVSIIDEQGNPFAIPSGTTASIEGTLNGSVGFTTSATISGNQISFALTESMTAYAGKAWCKIKLTLNDEPIQTCAFILAVDRAGVEADTVIGADGFQEQINQGVADYLDENPIPVDQEQIQEAVDDWLGGHIADCVMPQQFGAKANGVADDTSAIQAAINYAQNNNIRDVYFPSGIYKITAPLRVTVTTGTTPATGKPMYYYGLGCRLRGESIGTTIISKVGTGTMTIPSNDAYRGGETLDTVIYLGGTNGTGLFVSDMTIENGSSATDAWCVYATRARVAIDRANIASNSHGVFCYGWTNTLQDVVASCSSKAIEMTNCTSSVLNKVWANGENPYTINASYSTLISCCGDGCTGSVFTLSGNVAMIGCGSESPNCDRYVDVSGVGTVVTIENFYAWAFSSAGKNYFRASGGAVLAINGVRLSNNESSVSGAYMLAAATAARFALKNCSVYDNGGGTAYPALTGGLASGTQLVLDYGNYHGRYESDIDGNVLPIDAGVDAFFDVVGGHYEEVWEFNNYYTGKEDGYTYNSGSNPSKNVSSGYSVTNLVPAAMDDVIRTAGINLHGGDMTQSKLVFFDSAQNAIFATSIYNLTGQGEVDWGGTMDANGNVTYTINNNKAAVIQNTAYICFATRVTNIGANPAISVNEVIKSKTEYVGGSITLKDRIKVLTPTENDEPASKGYVDGKGYLTLADLPIYNGGVS